MPWLMDGRVCQGPALDGQVVLVDVVLAERGGSLRMHPPQVSGATGKRNPCAGKDLPVAFEAAGDQLVLHVKGSEVIMGCLDTRISLVLADGEYKGLMRGRSVSLKRS